MLHAVLLEDGVALVDGTGHTVHRELEGTGDIGDLGVGMVVQCADRALFKGVLLAHQAVWIGQHPAGDRPRLRAAESVLMQDPALFLFRQFHKHSFFPGPAAGPFSISIIKRQNPFGKSSAFVYNYSNSTF